ncbi:MAG: 30S ribosomal protein S4 [Candidatus Komeilibacteria bacterium RIFCSPLOWO2_01_FULL_53_11]|uniref:Small ribosomal subunit protein uS4 n=1 Tax=Candidatus Komeilibacteria bacterium RIFCSPLOWO2_01_FULL_53_11 TaxID=1798552 RepID=A0A1G2BUX4_9BACT|nr:MAG: 30S ribosomal protein S4 [Candidatus Komeilibacteria bacterium RIFCSPLOWO2_01_FULL_53_11]
MARALGPKHKLCRRLGVKLCDTYKCPVIKRNYPPGQHGQKKIRKKLSDYGKQLSEKQKAKYIYGLLERQFRTTFQRARKLSGNAGTNLLVLLERRFDNVIFRSGLAATKQLARQLVNHGHFQINGKRVDIPSYTVRVGDEIQVRKNKLNHAYWKNLIEAKKKTEMPGWLTTDLAHLTVRVVSEPKPEELPQNIETQLIVEYYSR